MSDKRNSIQWDDDLQAQLKKRQIAVVRNKTYVFFLAVFLFFVWPMIWSTVNKVRGEWAFGFKILSPIHSLFHARGPDDWWLLWNIEDLEKEIKQYEEDLAIVEIEKRVVEQLLDEKKQNTILNCLNIDFCDDISEELLAQIDFLRIFIIVNQLEWEKMKFDQKLLLRNLNEYMLRSSQWLEYWTINSVKFWDPEEVVQEEVAKDLKLRSVEIDLGILFPTKSWLINFLDNVENKAFLDLPVMYVIEGMNYDIPDYKSSQEVTMTLKAFYFEWLIQEEDVVSAE